MIGNIRNILFSEEPAFINKYNDSFSTQHSIIEIMARYNQIFSMKFRNYGMGILQSF